MTKSRFKPITWKIRNGEEVAIRQVAPGDKPLIRQGFNDLSHETIRLRFMGLRKGFTDEELAFLTEIDGVDHFALGVGNLEQTQGIAVIRYIRDVYNPEIAELALVITDKYQRQGLGTKLIKEIATHAKASGIRFFKGHLASENDGMKRLISKFKKTINADGTFLIEL
jgi:GNAT superfamily N-acetyltransferase